MLLPSVVDELSPEVVRKWLSVVGELVEMNVDSKSLCLSKALCVKVA